VLSLFPVGTSEEVSVIDKEGREFAFRLFEEDRLPIVCVPGTNINHPRQPEAFVVADPLETGPRKNLKQPSAAPTQESRTEAHARGWPKEPFRGLHPAARILVEERIRDQ